MEKEIDDIIAGKRFCCPKAPYKEAEKRFFAY